MKWTLALFFVFLSFDPLIEVIKVKVRDNTDYSRKENFVRWSELMAESGEDTTEAIVCLGMRTLHEGRSQERSMEHSKECIVQTVCTGRSTEGSEECSLDVVRT